MDAARADQPSGLSAREQAVLAFERQWWKYAGAKEQAIREIFDLSPTRYYQVLNRLLEKHEALKADPLLVKRLRRLRVGRQRVRAAWRRGGANRGPMNPGSTNAGPI
jgi:hypothetical protein